ncbi:MAG TPA: TonB-dependent receptor plug domain-containing protein, partial [Novosphingobium sp.]|nr:TonB-dependent receptor plug domain-containing protein [Novosphingobium sp.]
MRKMNRVAFAASTLAIAGAFVASPAFAQSTGSVDFENTIVVSGVGQKAVNGVDLPATPKAKQVLDQAFISRAIPGQSINDTIGMIPGVASFNADPFGSSGGKLYIRGFDNTRISETFDGMPLNDTGGYALYSNQMLDPELIDQVNVNLGTTDVDSPTASATGSTVNYRSRNPTEDFHARIVGSAGEYGFMRIFGVIDTGNLTKSGLRAWVSASSSTNNLFSGVSNGG